MSVETPTFKDIFKDIFRELKSTVSGIRGQDTPSQQPAPSSNDENSEKQAPAGQNLLPPGPAHPAEKPTSPAKASPPPAMAPPVGPADSAPLTEAQQVSDVVVNPVVAPAKKAPMATGSPAGPADLAPLTEGQKAPDTVGHPSVSPETKALPTAQALPDSALNPQATESSQPAKASTPPVAGSVAGQVDSSSKASSMSPIGDQQNSPTSNSGNPALQNQAHPASTPGAPFGQTLPSSDQNPQATVPTGQVSPAGQKNMPTDLSLQIQSDMSSFIYDPIDKKDPFEDPAAPEVGEDGKRKIPILPKTPPESYDLTEINLKGIIWDTESPKALFKLPDGGHFTLIKGDKIGRANGVIFEIRESEVVIVESQVLGKAAEKQEKTVIKIKKIDRLGLLN